MNAIAFDTHAHVKRLVGAGMSETVIEALRQTADLPDISHLATKADLQVTKAELQSAISEVKAELAASKGELGGEIRGLSGEINGLRSEIKGLRGELVWWIIGTGVVSTVAHLFIK